MKSMETRTLAAPSVEPCLANRDDRLVAGGGRSVQMPAEWAEKIASAPALSRRVEELEDIAARFVDFVDDGVLAYGRDDEKMVDNVVKAARTALAGGGKVRP